MAIRILTCDGMEGLRQGHESDEAERARLAASAESEAGRMSAAEQAEADRAHQAEMARQAAANAGGNGQ